MLGKTIVSRLKVLNNKVILNHKRKLHNTDDLIKRLRNRGIIAECLPEK